MNQDFHLLQLNRWIWQTGNQPDNSGGNDFSILSQGCVKFDPNYNGLDDDYFSVFMYSFVCEYTNQSLISCPGNLYLDSILGCGWFKLIILKKLKNFLFIIQYLVNKQTYNQQCSADNQCKYKSFFLFEFNCNK